MYTALHGRIRRGRHVGSGIGLAGELTAWTQMLALTDQSARRWEPKRLRLRLFTIPALLARSARTLVLHLASHAPWAGLAADGIHRLRTLGPAPG